MRISILLGAASLLGAVASLAHASEAPVTSAGLQPPPTTGSTSDASSTQLFGKGASTSAESPQLRGPQSAIPAVKPDANPLKTTVLNPERVQGVPPKDDYSLPATTRDPATVAQPPITSSSASKAGKVHEIVSPYDPAMRCVASQLNAQMRQISFTTHGIRDGTGQVNYVDGSATGTFSTQSADEMMLTSVAKTGSLEVNTSNSYRELVDWYAGKAASRLVGDGNTYVNRDTATGKTETTKTLPLWEGTIMPARVVLSGSISTLDFQPGGGAAITAPVQIGHRKYSIRVTMDLSATRMPVGSQPGGQVIASDSVEREVIATDDEFGLSHFFGPKGSPTYVAFDFGKQKREALMAVERTMLDREAAVLVARVHGITACDAQVAYGDQLAFSGE